MSATRDAARKARPDQARPTTRGSIRRGLIFAQEAHELALNAHPVGPENARLIGRIGGFERDRGAALAQPLQGRFFVVDERDDDVAGVGVSCFLMTTVSPSRMPASIIESPRTSSAKCSPLESISGGRLIVWLRL